MEWKCGFEGKVLTKGRRRCSGDEGKGFPLTSRGSFVTLTKIGKRAKENSEREQGIGEREYWWWGREKNPKRHGGGVRRGSSREGGCVGVWRSHEPLSPARVGGPVSRTRRRRRRRWSTRRSRNRSPSRRCSRAATPGCRGPTSPSPPPRGPPTGTGGASASPAPPWARSAPPPAAPACTTAASTRPGRPRAASR